MDVCSYDLTLLNHESIKGFFDGRLIIPAVDLIQVHVIQLQAAEGGVDRIQFEKS